MLELYRELQEQDLYVTAEKVKNAFMGHTIREHTLLSLFRQHLDNLEKVKGVTISPATVQKYDRTYRHLAEFLKAEYRVSDIALCEINHMFITDWERYLRTKCNCGANTTAKFMQSFRMIVLMARNNGWLIGDPFAHNKIKLEKVDRGYLTKEEIRRMAEKEFVCKRLEQVRDIFLFSCFTGLAYIDAKALTEDDIRPGFDDRLWIMTKRVKTNTDVRVPLLDFPLSILQKYKGKQAFKRVLPVLSNQKMNAYLKEIADVCGIQKNLTFASLVTTMRRPFVVERRAYRNALENVGAPEHPHDANLRGDHSGESEPRHGETLAAHRTDGELHLSGHIIRSSKMTSDERRKRHHQDRRVRPIESADRYRRYVDDGSGDRRTVWHDCRSGACWH